MVALLFASANLWGQQSEAEKSNLFLYGVGVSTEYDDQAGISDVVYSVRPHLGFSISRSRWESNLNYFPAFTYSVHRTNEYDAVAHSVGLTFSRRFTKRLTLDVQSSFTLTSNPFDTLRANSELEQPDVINRPNSTLAATNRSRRMGQVVGTLTRALSARSSVGIGGNFLRLDYRDGVLSPSGLSQRSISDSANMFYSHQVGKRSSMELRYIFQKIDFDRGAVRTDAHSLLYAWSFSPTSAVKLSVFAGPGYSVTQSQPATSLLLPQRSSDFSPVGGATFNWSGGRTSLGGSATQQIADGGGTRGSVRLDTFSLEASQQLSKRTTVRGFANYNLNHLLLPTPGLPQSFNYLAGGAGVSHKISEHTSLGLVYWHIQQDDLGQPQLGSRNSWNRVGVTVSYDNQRPLGR